MKYRRCGIRGVRLFLVALCVVYIAAACLLSPRAVALSELEIRRAALDAVHRAADDVLKEYGEPFGEIGTRTDGTVAFVQTNTGRLTHIQTQVCTAVTEELAGIRRISVRMGSLLPVAVFSGRGPKIPLRLEPDGMAEVTFHNEFLSAGVNQTLHRVCMDVMVTVTARATWYSRPQVVQASFVLGETVIVGEVPNSIYGMRGTQ